MNRRAWKHIRAKTLFFVGAKATVWMIALAFASDIAVHVTTYQAEVGSAVNVANGLLVTDRGFATATSSSSPIGTNCSSPVTFGSTPQTANTTITSGHWVFDIQVNSTTNAQAGKYNVTFVLASNTYGPLCIQTPASPQDGQTIDCRFDVGSSLPMSPYTFKITVQ